MVSIEMARTMVVNSIVIMEIFYLFSVTTFMGLPSHGRGLFGTPAALIGVAVVTTAQLALTYLPFMQGVFGTQSIPPTDRMLLVGIGLARLLMIEFEKRIYLHITSSSRRRIPGVARTVMLKRILVLLGEAHFPLHRDVTTIFAALKAALQL